MVKIYVVDNGGQWTHREWRVLKYLNVDTKIIPNTTPMDEIDADGLVLSGGSPRIGTESAKLGLIGTYIDSRKLPLLGICVSHQFMALHYGGRAGPSEIPEYGKVTVHIDVDDSKIFSGVPKTFTAWESHNDEIKFLPDMFRIIAHSENCRIQAIEHKTLPFFGTQFHPEVEHTEYGSKIFENFIDICRR